MGVLKRFWWLFIIIAAAAIWWIYRNPPTVRDPESSGRTALEIEIAGGFAYVTTLAENRLEIAFPSDVNVPGCNIDQLGTDLMVLSGTIVEPAPAPANSMFDLEGAVVTFPALEAENQPLRASRQPGRPNPNRPANPNNANEWEPLHWIPRITGEFPASSLNPSWRSMVNGRLVVRGGTLKGLHPSDVIVNNSIFDFRRNSGESAFQQALTDRTHYSVDFPRDRVEILLAGAKSGIRRIVLTAPSPTEPVILKLMGRHTAGTPASLPIGSPVEDFCVFYQLLQPVPPQADWLMPVYLGPAAKPGEAPPNPGPFCTPSFFP